MFSGTGIVFTTLSNVVLDELRFPGKDILTDVVGGPGAYGQSVMQTFQLQYPRQIAHTEQQF